MNTGCLRCTGLCTVALAVLLVACSSSSTSPKASSQPTAPSAATSATSAATSTTSVPNSATTSGPPAASANACSALTAAQISAAVGTALPSQAPDGQFGCTWSDPAGNSTLSIRVQPAGPSGIALYAGPQSHMVSGLGNAAVYSKLAGLHFVVGKWICSVSLLQLGVAADPTHNEAAVVDLGRILEPQVAKLPS